MNKAIHRLIDEQVQRWEMQKKQDLEPVDTCRVITISRECGSRGKQVAESLSQALGFDLFHYIMKSLKA